MQAEFPNQDAPSTEDHAQYFAGVKKTGLAAVLTQGDTSEEWVDLHYRLGKFKLLQASYSWFSASLWKCLLPI